MMVKKIILFVSISVLIVLILCGIYIQNEDSANSMKFQIRVSDNIVQHVSLYYHNDTYYAFLPSYTDLTTMSVSLVEGCSLFLDGVKYGDENSFADIVLEKEYRLEIKNLIGISVCNSGLIFMKGNQTATLSISLVDGTIDDVNSSKAVSKTGYAVLVTPEKDINYCGNFKDLHGRGNSTWGEPKKSYTLEFATAVDLLGMGADDGWVLMGNSFDESGLRNKLVYDISKRLGVDYAVDSEYVDLYIDDVYYGLYLLSERVQVGENRVNIDDLYEKTQNLNSAPLKSYLQKTLISEDGRIVRGFDIPNNPEDITGGYLFQIEHHDDRISYKESLVQTNELSFSLTSPKYASMEQANYLFEYLNRVEDNILNGDFSDLDLESFAKYYLMQEVFANHDNCSVYFYKDSDSVDEKLKACTIWDMDLSIGNGWLSFTDPQKLYRNRGNWFNYLYEHSSFKSLVIQQYNECLVELLQEGLYNQLLLYKKQINNSFAMDKIRWQKYAGSGPFANQCQHRFETLDEHINFMVDYMEQRTEYLNSVWAEPFDN